MLTKLKQHRMTILDLSQAEICKRAAGLRVWQISQFESGKLIPPKYQKKLAAAYRLSIPELNAMQHEVVNTHREGR